jgi:hypothetical protein
MFKPHYGDCSNPNCNRKDVLIPVKSGFCDKCNYERKQGNKSQRKTTDTPNLRGSGRYKVDVGRRQEIAREAVRRLSSKNPTGEREIFAEISNERDWRCYVTGIELKELKASQFAHVLPKALNKYPLFKLYKNNIVLLSDEVHYAWDFKPRSELKKDSRFDKLFVLEEELKQEYKLLKSKP